MRVDTPSLVLGENQKGRSTAAPLRHLVCRALKASLGPTVQKDELVRYIADRTGLNEGEVDIVLRELRDAVIFFNRQGRGVKLEGLGTYLPNIRLDGILCPSANSPFAPFPIFLWCFIEKAV